MVPASLTRLDNVMKGIANSAEDVSKKLGQGEESLEFYKGETGKRFSGALDLRDAEKDLQKLRREIGGGKADDEPEGDAYEVEGDTEVSAIITDSDDESYEAARATVMGEVSAAMQSGGRDFVMPSQAEVDERIAKELLKMPAPARTEPPSAPAPDPIEEPDTAAVEPVAAVDERPTVSTETVGPGQPVADEIDPIEEADSSTADRAAEEGDAVPGRYDEMLERIRAERDADAAGVPADTQAADPDPVGSEPEYAAVETAADVDAVADLDDVPADTSATDTESMDAAPEYAAPDPIEEPDAVADLDDVPADTSATDTESMDAAPEYAAPDPIEEPDAVADLDDVPADTSATDTESMDAAPEYAAPDPIEEPDAVADLDDVPADTSADGPPSPGLRRRSVGTAATRRRRKGVSRGPGNAGARILELSEQMHRKTVARRMDR